MSVIEVNELTKVFQTGLRRGNVVALDSLTLTVKPGEIFGLLGPNGAGKTTLVKLLLGIIHPTSGRIEIQGLSPSDPNSRLRIGYLGENFRYPQHLTGLGLLTFAGRLYGLNAERIRERAIHLMNLVEMDKWANVSISKYSKGMTQRVGLAQAMLANPDLIILDEPTDGVDPIGRVEIKKILEQIRAEGKTIFVNSHLLSEVETLADRVAIISRGRLVKVGTIAELTSRKNQFRIEAEIGDQKIDIAPEVGKRILISRDELHVEVVNELDINIIIDQLRIRKIAIRSVVPIKVSLEQSFMESIGGGGKV